MINTLTSHDLEAMVFPKGWRRIPLDELVTLSTAMLFCEDNLGQNIVTGNDSLYVNTGNGNITIDSNSTTIQYNAVINGSLKVNNNG